MPDIVETTQAVLIAAGGVTSRAPASRIKPPGDWQNLARDYIVHFPADAGPIHTHGGLAGLKLRGYQVSCFSDSNSGARALALAVRQALDGIHSGVTYFWTGESLQYETDTKVHHVAVFFETWGDT